MKARRSHPAPRDPLGSVAESSETALLLIDVINAFDFPEADKLMRFALPAARRIATLKIRLRNAGIPAIYLNDNFGRWQSDFRAQVERCAGSGSAGAEITELLRPDASDYFILKPKHSGFYSTSLDVLLHYLGARRLVLAGFAGNLCVFYTANDAYMRDFTLFVPEDCIASETAAMTRTACEHMKRFLKADVRRSNNRGMLRAMTTPHLTP